VIELSVNIDHVATLRQARQTYEPDPVWAAVEAHLGGADGITVHLREDRRHIQDEDVRRLRELVHIKLNLEMAATDEMVDIAVRLKPEMAMLVPEGRHEITTEGGLDVAGQEAGLRAVVARALAKDPEARFPDASAMADELAALVERLAAGWARRRVHRYVFVMRRRRTSNCTTESLAAFPTTPTSCASLPTSANAGRSGMRPTWSGEMPSVMLKTN